MDFLTGPVLYFRGWHEKRLLLAALIVIPARETPPPLVVDGGKACQAQVLAQRLGKTVWRYDFALSVKSGEEGASYALGDRSFRVHLPQDNAWRVAYTACNGFEHDNHLDDRDPNRNERWRHLAREHARSPFHLLIQGGDQLYADDVWRAIPELSEWRRQSRQNRIAAHLSPAVAEAIADFYFQQYCRLWAQSDLAPLLASIPSLMMWDDHDIFDGWGSHRSATQQCPVFQVVGNAAREQFSLFQLGSKADELPAGFGDPTGDHFGWSYRLGEIGVIAPDLRSERTRHRVMSETAWRWLTASLEKLSQCRSILLVSTVPVLNIDLSLVERAVVWLPPGRHFYQDDLRDQWRSYAHRREWLRLVDYLLDFTGRTGTSIIALSGEIHLGAYGMIERGDNHFVQLTSSGIVHPPPPKLLARIYDFLGRGSAKVGDGTELKMLPLPGLGSRYLADRNWLSLDYETAGRWHAQWHAEESQVAIKMKCN